MDEVFRLIKKEEKRQAETIDLIASENYVSKTVAQAVGSVLGNKYAEGYPGKRYYQGNKFVDEIENLAIDRAKRIFQVAHANVQPHSGCEANLAVISALTNVGEPIMSQSLSMGGHLSHGQEASFTSKIVDAHYYGLTDMGEIDWIDLETKARKFKPKLIFCGGTGFTKLFDFARFAEIADQVGAYFVADIAHIAGLVAGGAHPSPAQFAHIITTTTHKTLRGPRGAIVMVTNRGLDKDSELSKKIDRAVFPGLQGGPHENSIAGIAVALAEAETAEFQAYAKQIVKNAQVLAKELLAANFKLVGGGTENHMVWIDLRNKGIDGWTAALALEAAGIITNRQAIPNDPNPPYYPSGLRLGTPAVTTRGMKKPEIVKIAGWINEVIGYIQQNIGVISCTSRVLIKEKIKSMSILQPISRHVTRLVDCFPIYYCKNK